MSKSDERAHGLFKTTIARNYDDRMENYIRNTRWKVGVDGFPEYPTPVKDYLTRKLTSFNESERCSCQQTHKRTGHLNPFCSRNTLKLVQIIFIRSFLGHWCHATCCDQPSSAHFYQKRVRASSSHRESTSWGCNSWASPPSHHGTQGREKSVLTMITAYFDIMGLAVFFHTWKQDPWIQCL